KAQFDAHRLARQRDASFYLDYGYTRPKVISEGHYQQHKNENQMLDSYESLPTEQIPAGSQQDSIESVPTPPARPKQPASAPGREAAAPNRVVGSGKYKPLQLRAV